MDTLVVIHWMIAVIIGLGLLFAVAFVGLTIVLSFKIYRLFQRNEHDEEIVKATRYELEKIRHNDYYIGSAGYLCLICEREYGDHGKLDRNRDYVRLCNGSLIKLVEHHMVPLHSQH